MRSRWCAKAGPKVGEHVTRNLSLRELRAAPGQRPAREWRPHSSACRNELRRALQAPDDNMAAILILAREMPAENLAMLAQTSDLQNPELTNGCCLKPRSLWSFVTQQEKANATG